MVVVEDQAETFQPLFKDFVPGRRGKSSFPAMNFEAPPGICPFYPQHVIDEKNAGKLKAHRERETARREEERAAFNALPPAEKIARARKKGPKAGYCECCRIDYTDVNKVRPYLNVKTFSWILTFLSLFSLFSMPHHRSI